MRSEKRGLADQVVGNSFHRNLELIADFLHAAEVKTNACRQAWMRS
jgi:hypothetical protein